jgi:hypothetical protein
MSRLVLAALVLGVTPAAKAQSQSQAQSLAARPAQAAAARRDSTDTAARFGRLTTALNTTELNTRRFLGITGLKPARLTFVDVRDWVSADMMSALDATILRNARAITAMRSDLQNSLLLRDALVERDLTMSQVVAVEVSPDASQATVFYRKGAEHRYP